MLRTNRTCPLFSVLLVVACTGAAAEEGRGERARPNVLFMTADDLGYGSLGVTGCTIPEITPHLDRLAAGGLRFEHGHVTVAVCQPCRQVLMTGRYPMRCLETRRFGYLFNAWSDGQTLYRNSAGGETLTAMRQAAGTDPAVAARVRLFEHRVPEEFYDYAGDPHALTNLIDGTGVTGRGLEQLARWLPETSVYH